MRWFISVETKRHEIISPGNGAIWYRPSEMTRPVREWLLLVQTKNDVKNKEGAVLVQVSKKPTAR